MVVDKYVSRCLDVGSTPTGSISILHCFVNLSKTLFLQRFSFYSLVFLCIPFYTKDTTKDTTFCRILKNLYILQSVPRLYYKGLRNISFLSLLQMSCILWDD